MSTWQRFYYAWGGFAGVLAVTLLVVLALPSVIAFAAALLVPVMVMLGLYAVFFVRCPKCGVRITETVIAHGLPQEQCPMCLYDLKAVDSRPSRR